MLTYRNEDHRAQAEAWFKQRAHPQPMFVIFDVTDRERWVEIADEVGPVHTLVNNAGLKKR